VVMVMKSNLNYEGPELIADYNCKIGEGVLWHPEEKRVYWTDIPTGRMFRYDPLSDRHEQFYDGEVVGGFTVQLDGSLLLFMNRGAVKIYRDGNLKEVISKISGEEDSRFNDVIADPEGRVFCGTMPTEKRPGRLYRLDRGGGIERIRDKVEIPNGMGFTLDGNGLYFTESGRGTIHFFDYDRQTGEITRNRTFTSVESEKGVPDGMTVDSEGYVWSARWNGGCIVRYSPDGEQVEKIEFPTRKVTSLAFGGESYEDLYVTTAGGDDRAEEGQGAGGLFRIKLRNLKGISEYKSDVKPTDYP